MYIQYGYFKLCVRLYFQKIDVSYMYHGGIIYEEKFIYIMSVCPNCCETFNNQDCLQSSNNKLKTKKRKLVIDCLVEEGRVNRSSQYKCCSRRRIDKDKDKDNTYGVASANMIKTQTKPTPSCGERSSNNEGCDNKRRYTSCHTAFNITTGKMNTMVVHNPHFFQYKRAIKRGMSQCNTNNIPEYHIICNIVNKLRSLETPAKSLARKLMKFYRLIVHVQANEVVKYKNKVYEETSAMEKRLYINGKSRTRNMCILEIFELISDVGLDWVCGLCDFPASDDEALILLVQEEVNKIEELFEYCNKEWANHSSGHRISILE